MAKEKTSKMKNVSPETHNTLPTKEKYYPSFNLELKDIPEARNWKVGSNYMFLIGVKMKSIREDEHSSSVGFDILKIKSINKGDK